MESWRSWFPLLKPYRLEPLGDWPGERYTNVSDPQARDVLAISSRRSSWQGIRWLFLDLIDMTEDHPAQMDGMIDLVQRISARVHAGGGVLMAQNGDSVIDRFTASLDAWNREDTTGTYDFDRERYVRASPQRTAAPSPRCVDCVQPARGHEHRLLRLTRAPLARRAPCGSPAQPARSQ